MIDAIKEVSCTRCLHHCSKCRDVEPIAKVLNMLNFCDDSDVEIIISCKHSDRCRAIAEYLKNQK